MNILFITHSFYPEVNACASRVFERARYWVEWGHDVTVVTSLPHMPEGKVYDGYQNKWMQTEDIDGIRVVRVKTLVTDGSQPKKRILSFFIFMLMSFFGALFRKADCVAVTSPQLLSAVSAWLVSAIKRKPFVLEISDIWPASIKAVGAINNKRLLSALEKLELFLYRRADHIVVLTQAFKQNLVSRGVSKDKITVIKNGVDTTLFKPQTPDITLLTQYGLENKFVVAYIGLLGYAQGLDHVLSAAELLKENPDIHFMFLGGGPCKSALLEKTQLLDLQNVSFIDRQPKECMPDHWSLADVALVNLKNDPVFEEVIPSKLFEAMAMQKPVVLAAPKGEAHDVLVKANAGVWVPPEDPQALVDVLLLLSKSDEQCSELAENAYRSSQSYNRETQARKMLKTLEMI